MSLVNAETGELLATMTPDEARDLTEQIKTALGMTWEMVKTAYTGRAWAALGYRSWDDYTNAELAATRLRLPREERQEVVSSLRDAGLSIRAIASATGASDKTVQRDLAARVVNDYTSAEPAPEPIDDDEWEPGGWLPADQQPTPAPRPIVGTDGKTYTAPPPRPKPTAEEQRAIDVLNARQRTARALETLTDVWPYMRAWVNERDEILPHLQDCTVQALDAIQEAMQ